MELLEKQYFLPGDTVQVKKLPNSPIMLVVKKATSTMTLNGVKNTYFQGLVCKWFTDSGFIQTEIFNTKDLQKI